MSKKNVFAGKIEEKQELSTYNDKDSVINLIVSTKKVIAGTITTTIKRTIVLFKGDAVKADRSLKVGDMALFTEVERSPRIYKNKKQEEIQVLDLRANGFTKLTAKEFKDNKDALADLMITELDFTDEDGAKLAKQAEAVKAALLSTAAAAAATLTGTEEAATPVI